MSGSESEMLCSPAVRSPGVSRVICFLSIPEIKITTAEDCFSTTGIVVSPVNGFG
ncbi:MAG: hypothetical protein JWP12_870 [Bacteroidetes bacterium]|nr:hypothetical protein [Bacteroidota bacterium]